MVSGLIELLNTNSTDWTRFSRSLASLRVKPLAGRRRSVRDLVIDRAAFDAWAAIYRSRLAAENSIDSDRAVRMNRVNPKYVLRNHLAETAIARARGDQAPHDFSEVARLLAILERPYDEQPEHEAYAAEPPEWAQSLHLSCSS